MHKKFQDYLFQKNYKKISEQIKKMTKKNLSPQEDIVLEICDIKLQLYNAAVKGELAQSLDHYKQYSSKLKTKFNFIQKQILQIYTYSLNFFIFQILPQSNSIEQANEHYHNSQEKLLIKDLENLPSVSFYTKNQSLMNQLKNSTYLALSFVQLQTKKLILNKRKQSKNDIYELLKFIGQLKALKPQTLGFIIKIQLILIHLRIYFLNSTVKIVPVDVAHQMLQLVIQQYDNTKSLVFDHQTTIALLYNVAKILLGTDKVHQDIQEGIGIIFKKNDLRIPNNYPQTIFGLFLVIKMIIFHQSQTLNNQKLPLDSNKMIREDDYGGQIQGEDSFLSQKFSTFLNINLDTTYVQLKQVCRNIIRHRVASLATMIGFKLGIQNLAINFLQLMHDNPFNNDIQTIKLCFELFQARQFQKLQHLFQVVLSASTCKNLKQREVLIAMCSIFIGIYLQNRQEGLLYAKLNHSQNKKCILREETLLQHIGFAYYNLAKGEVYLCNQQIYMVKALQNFEKSYEINSNNYVVAYCMSKIYLNLCDYQNAYKYALESCKCNRGRWVPFSLLACVYMCQRKINKAMIIVDELIKKYPEEVTLYYIRAYIQVNKILLQVQYDQQVQAAKQMDQQIYDLTKQKVLRSKPMNSLTFYCQQFYNRSLQESRQFDQNFFNISNNFVQQNHQTFTNFQDIGNKNILLMIINLFIQMDQIQTAQNLLKTIPEHHHVSQLKFYKALVHEKKKQFQPALQQYKKILEKDNYHVDSLVQCALLQRSQVQALSFITLAGKFTNNSKFLFAKGMVLSRLGRFQQANEVFLTEGQRGWIEQLPQKLYYY